MSLDSFAVPSRHVNSLSWRSAPASADYREGGTLTNSTWGIDAAPSTDFGRERARLDLEGIYAYCFDRGDGRYTRLVPADMLPPLAGVPTIQHGSEGMMVLPLPPGLPPDGVAESNVQPVVLMVSRLFSFSTHTHTLSVSSFPCCIFFPSLEQ